MTCISLVCDLPRCHCIPHHGVACFPRGLLATAGRRHVLHASTGLQLRVPPRPQQQGSQHRQQLLQTRQRGGVLLGKLAARVVAAGGIAGTQHGVQLAVRGSSGLLQVIQCVADGVR